MASCCEGDGKKEREVLEMKRKFASLLVQGGSHIQRQVPHETQHARMQVERNQKVQLQAPHSDPEIIRDVLEWVVV